MNRNGEERRILSEENYLKILFPAVTFNIRLSQSYWRMNLLLKKSDNQSLLLLNTTFSAYKSTSHRTLMSNYIRSIKGFHSYSHPMFKIKRKTSIHNCSVVEMFIQFGVSSIQWSISSLYSLCSVARAKVKTKN